MAKPKTLRTASSPRGLRIAGEAFPEVPIPRERRSPDPRLANAPVARENCKRQHYSRAPGTKRPWEGPGWAPRPGQEVSREVRSSAHPITAEAQQRGVSEGFRGVLSTAARNKSRCFCLAGRERSHSQADAPASPSAEPGLGEGSLGAPLGDSPVGTQRSAGPGTQPPGPSPTPPLPLGCPTAAEQLPAPGWGRGTGAEGAPGPAGGWVAAANFG